MNIRLFIVLGQGVWQQRAGGAGRRFLSSALSAVARSLLAFLVISVLSLFIITMMPADPVRIAIHLWNLPAGDATIRSLQAAWGLDQPFIARYLHWLMNFVQGDWGRSFRTSEPIWDEFATRLPVSLSLGLGGLVLAFFLSIPLGFFAALKLGGIVDCCSAALSVFVQTVPGFLLGLLLLWGLGVNLRWIRPFANNWSAFALPMVIIALHSLVIFTRIYRHDMVAATAQPHFRTALAKGLSRQQALWRHSHRSALYALLAALRAQAGWAIGSTATMEILFNLPGISQFLVQSIEARDQMVLQAYVMVIAVWMLLVNIFAHSVMHLLEPRLE